MAQRILFHGAPARTRVTQTTHTDAALQVTGGNTGNLLIGSGLESQLAGSGRFFELRNAPPPPERANDEFDIIVIAASNFIYEGFDCGYIGDFIEKTNLPCAVVGIGAQARDRGSPITIPEGTQRFLKIVSERTPLIGVRGAFTADVLNHLGIRNVEVTGCPSLYPLQRPPAMVLPSEMPSPDRLVLNGSRDVVTHSFDPDTMLSVEREIFYYAMREKIDYVMQAEYQEILFSRNFAEFGEKIFQELLKIWGIEDTGMHQAFREQLQMRCHSFFHISDWASFIKSKTLSIGSRFHGNVMAMINGVATILIIHDTRTTELAEHIGLPRFRPIIGKKFSIEDVLGNTDSHEFNTTYPRRRYEYAKFLEKIGLESNFDVHIHNVTKKQ